MYMNFSKLWELVMDREAKHAAVHEDAKSWTQLSDWTELNVSPAMQITSLLRLGQDKGLLNLNPGPTTVSIQVFLFPKTIHDLCVSEPQSVSSDFMSWG